MADTVNSGGASCGSSHTDHHNHHHGGPSEQTDCCGPPPDGAPSADGESPRLSDLLTDGWRLYEEVESSAEPGGSSPVQRKVRLGLGKLEEATRMVSQLDLFSRNEELEEVSTTDLKYLLLPALQGALTMKLSDRAKRLEAVRAARAHFYDFLRRCKDYNVSKFSMPKTSTIEEEDEEGEEGEESRGGGVVTTVSCSPAPPRAPDLVAMASQRQAKIDRYRQRKETEARIAEMKESVEAERADDEAVREYYLLHVRRWVCVALEEIQSIDEEMDILKRMGSLSHGGGGGGGPPRQPARAPMKPFILTKDAVQARVFGAGYPSLPTMTVDDWYDQHQRHGVLPDQGVASRAMPRPSRDGADPVDPASLEEEEKERRQEEDDREALQKARDWDNWKESHQRGYGNRKNMG